jgi:hypothetical protein
MQNTLAILAATTAILAVVIGPLVSLRIARKRAQLEAVVLVRAEAVKQLRSLFSEFIAYLMVANTERGVGLLSRSESTQKLERAFRLETEISLILDAEDEDGRVVMENMCAARNRVFKDSDSDFDPRRWEPHYYAASAALIQILKKEQQNVAKLR